MVKHTGEVGPPILTEGITVVERGSGRRLHLGPLPNSDAWGVSVVGDNGREQITLVLIESGAVLSFAYGPADCLRVGMGEAPVSEPGGYINCSTATANSSQT